MIVPIALAHTALAAGLESARLVDGYQSAPADSLLLAMVGIALILAAALLRGLSHLDSSEYEEADGHCAPGTPRFEVIAPHMPTQLAERNGLRPLLSVDVEDYFQTEAMSAAGHRKSWDTLPLRVVDNTRRLLDLFEEFDSRATFFTVGWIANRVPWLIREIAERGHEVACHSYWHRTVYSLTEQEFRQDTRAAITAIQDACGVQVIGYRAPTWSITRRSLWAIGILAEEGFLYDSSIYPIHHDLYGIPGASVAPHVWRVGGREMLEIPPATYTFGNTRIPAAGGGYLRIFPLRFSCMAIDQLARHNALPVVYMHPWEIDPDQPRLDAPWKSRMRQYWGLSSYEPKLRELLGRYQFVSFQDRYMDLGESAPKVPITLPDLAVAS